MDGLGGGPNSSGLKENPVISFLYLLPLQDLGFEDKQEKGKEIERERKRERERGALHIGHIAFSLGPVFLLTSLWLSEYLGGSAAEMFNDLP